MMLRNLIEKYLREPTKTLALQFMQSQTISEPAAEILQDILPIFKAIETNTNITNEMDNFFLRAMLTFKQAASPEALQQHDLIILTLCDYIITTFKDTQKRKLQLNKTVGIDLLEMQKFDVQYKKFLNNVRILLPSLKLKNQRTGTQPTSHEPVEFPSLEHYKNELTIYIPLEIKTELRSASTKSQNEEDSTILFFISLQTACRNMLCSLDHFKQAAESIQHQSFVSKEDIERRKNDYRLQIENTSSSLWDLLDHRHKSALYVIRDNNSLSDDRKHTYERHVNNMFETLKDHFKVTEDNIILEIMDALNQKQQALQDKKIQSLTATAHELRQQLSQPEAPIIHPQNKLAEQMLPTDMLQDIASELKKYIASRSGRFFTLNLLRETRLTTFKHALAQAFLKELTRIDNPPTYKDALYFLNAVDLLNLALEELNKSKQADYLSTPLDESALTAYFRDLLRIWESQPAHNMDLLGALTIVNTEEAAPYRHLVAALNDKMHAYTKRQGTSDAHFGKQYSFLMGSGLDKCIQQIKQRLLVRLDTPALNSSIRVALMHR